MTKELTHQEKIEQLLDKMRAFLSTPNHCDDCWPVIPDQEMGDFRDLIYDAVDIKWDRDCDRDSPVGFVVWDKKQRSLICQAMREHENSDLDLDSREKILRENLRSASWLVSAGNTEISTISRSLDHLAAERFANANTVTVYRVKYTPDASWTVPNDQPCSIHRSMNEAVEFADAASLQYILVSTNTAKMGIGYNSSSYETWKAALESRYDRILPLYTTARELGIR